MAEPLPDALDRPNILLILSEVLSPLALNRKLVKVDNHLVVLRKDQYRVRTNIHQAVV